MIKLRPIPKKIYKKAVLLRVDFNIPIRKREIVGDIRLVKTLPTINLLRRRGARVILISHLEKEGGRPSMRPVFNQAKKKIKGLRFAGGLTDAKTARVVKSLKPGEILMLENLRLNPGEKKNSPIFAKKLASMADIYINEAFSVSHRSHASIVGLPKLLPSYAGLLFKNEIKNLSLAFRPLKPFTLIVGGNKLETKIPLIKKFLKKADRVVIGGALAAPFLFGKEKRFKSSKIFLPTDVIVERKGKRTMLDTALLKKSDVIYDLGPKTMKEVSVLIKKSRFVLWNGPLGFVEKGYVHSTLNLARALRSSRAKVIAGGGDTSAFLRKHRLTRGFHFISTAGGAMLDFLVCGTLPGIDALKRNKK